MNELEKATGGVDVIDLLDNMVNNTKRKAQMEKIGDVMGEAIEKLNNAKQATPAGYATTIEINGWEFDCIVDYEIEPFCAGERGEYGQQVSPDSEVFISMGQVYIFDTRWELVDIPEKAMKDTLDEILEECHG